MAKTELKSLKNEAKSEIEKALSQEQLNEVFKKYLGKKGKITLILKSLSKLSERKRIETGKEANEIKRFLEEKIKEKKTFLC